MKFSIDIAKTPDVEWNGFKAWVYNNKEQFSAGSALYIELEKEHGMVKSMISDRYYLILEGIVEFDIAGITQTASRLDTIVIPKNTPYNYRNLGGPKAAKLYLVHSPAFDADKEIKL